ncbi:MAG TPA: MAE_28990/MAE_18760 family HEPN-like nuclease [Conexibacter sp.]|nr:MAE_28990/MAE_18760 family HEPN-like nuclease [Conexibacter sp.]
MPAGPFDRLLADIGFQLDQIRQQLYYADAQSARAEGVLPARYSRAMAYVALAAALEDFVKRSFDVLCEEINRSGVALAKVRLGIVSLEQASRFDSVASSRKQRIWTERASVLQRAASDDILTLNSEVRPFDGRTIRTRHIETLWHTFEIEGTALPRPQLHFALEDLSEGRNAVAHGNADPATFGRRKSFKDLYTRVDQVEELAIYIVEAFNRYVRDSRFLRQPPTA